MNIKELVKRVLLNLPPWSCFDHLIALIYFWVAHHRLPSRTSGLFNDFLFYLKTSNEMNDPLRQFVSDKDLVKYFYRGLFLDKNIAPHTLLKFHDFDSLKSANLPFSCVLKPTHLSGCIFLTPESPLTNDKLEQVSTWFSTNIYYNISRERNYKNLKPYVICEEVLACQKDIRDYKIFCYLGKPRLIQVDVDRHSNHKRRLYTTEWHSLSVCYNKPLAEVELMPDGLQEALRMARRIASFFSFIRVDTYIISGRVYLGELTSVPENAHGRFENIEEEQVVMDLLTRAENQKVM